MSRHAVARLLPLLFLGLCIPLGRFAVVQAEDDDDDEATPASPIPREVRDLQDKANACFRQKNYADGRGQLEKILEKLDGLKVTKEVKTKIESSTRYDIACCHAQMGKTPEAIKELAKSIELGFWDWDHIAKDEDLDSLRKEDDFKKAIEKGKAGQTETCKAAVEKALAEKPLLDLDIDKNGLDGKPIKLADLKGKVVLVVYWSLTDESARHIQGLAKLDPKLK